MSGPEEEARERWAIDAMVSALPPLRRAAEAMRDAWGDRPDARIADALRMSLALFLQSIATPGSHAMAAADAALIDLTTTTTEEGSDDE